MKILYFGKVTKVCYSLPIISATNYIWHYIRIKSIRSRVFFQRSHWINLNFDMIKSSQVRLLTQAARRCVVTVYELAFPTGRDSATFRDKGTEVSSLSRDKGTTGQAQNLAMGRDGPGQSVKIWDGTRDRTITIFQSKSGTGHGTGQGLNILPRDGTGFWQPVPSRPGTSRGTEMKEKALKKWDFFLIFLHHPVLEHTFSVLERPFPVLELPFLF